jgi:hypothetical protein
MPDGMREEDAIIIAQSKIVCLDYLSLEGNVPNYISKTSEDLEIDNFTMN